MKKKGVTLIENVIAVVLLGVLITAMVYSFASARIYASSARHRYQAINLARVEIENIIRGDLPTAGDITKEGVTYTRAISPNPPADGDLVTVTVSWPEIGWGDLTESETIVIQLP